MSTNGPPMMVMPQTLPPDQDRGVWLLPLDWTVRSVAIFIVILRFYTRGVLKRALGWDDYSIAVAALLILAEGAVETVRIQHGLGRHIEYLSREDLHVTSRLVLPVQLCNFISLFFTRTSICLFTLRLLAPSHTWPRRITYTAILLNFLSTLANCIVFGLQCYDLTEAPHSGCVNPGQLRAAFFTLGSLNIAVDFVNVGIPVFVIRGVQMSPRLKASAIFIVSLGLITCGCGIGKVISTRDITDPSFDGVDVSAFGAFEESTGIIFASMPAMHQLYSYLRDRWSSSTPPARKYAEIGGSGSSRSDRTEYAGRSSELKQPPREDALEMDDLESPQYRYPGRSGF